MIKVGRMNESVSQNDNIANIDNLLKKSGIKKKYAYDIESLDSKGVKLGFKYAHDDDYRKAADLLKKTYGASSVKAADFNTTIIVKLNESIADGSTEMNESALSVAKISYSGGPVRPFPDGSSKGDMIGSNKAIEVNVVYAGSGYSKDGDYSVEAFFTSDEDDEFTLEKYFKTGKDAISFANKLLKEVTDPMLDAKKVAKKYNMEYVEA